MANPRQPPEAAFHHPSLGRSTKSSFASGSFTICRSIPLSWAAWRVCPPCVALVAQRQFYFVIRGLLHLLAECPHVGPSLLVGWRHMHCKQIAQSAHRHMNLAAMLAFVIVIASMQATLAVRQKCSPIHHHGTGLPLTSLRSTDDGAQVRRRCLEAVRIVPAPTLLVQGGRSLGNSCHGAPARTSQRRALKTSRKSCSRCGACRSIKARKSPVLHR